MTHDQLVKDLLRTFFADFLSLVLPDLMERLRLGEEVFLDKQSFTDWPAGSRREMDLLVRIPVRGEQASVLIHVEIEAQARAGMDRRMWGYYMQIRLRHGLLVVPIVACLRGGSPGLRRETLLEGFAAPDTAGFRYYTFCLSGCRSEDYLGRSEPLAWALAALMRPGRRTRASLKMECLRRIAEARLTGIQRFLLANFVETYLQLSGAQAEEYSRLQRLAENREVTVMQMTWADKIEAQGIEKGRAEAVQTLRRVVLRLLEQRFGVVPVRTKRKIEKLSSLEPLTHLAEKAVVAGSLDELGL